MQRSHTAAPPRKLTQEDQQNWKIPPSISNWKNIKGTLFEAILFCAFTLYVAQL
jgi:hypothetical protein